MKDYKSFIDDIITIIPFENILLNEHMKDHTSFKIGGCADIMVLPDNAQQLTHIIKVCRQYNINYIIVGNGSNLLVTDKGIRGVVIKTFNGLKNITVKDTYIECDSGVLLSKLANIACDNNLEGLEFASGIPGTLGGAITMNAGAYGGEIKDVVTETTYIDGNGEIQKVCHDNHKFGYRTSIFQGTEKVILSSILKLKRGDKETIKIKMNDFNNRRKDKQPLNFPSAGSTFRRPEGHYVGKLIEDSGLRGYSIGGAQISEKHCGFIINNGNATAEDVLKLIEYIQEQIKSKYDVQLQTELKVIGER